MGFADDAFNRSRHNRDLLRDKVDKYFKKASPKNKSTGKLKVKPTDPKKIREITENIQKQERAAVIKILSILVFTFIFFLLLYKLLY